MSLKKNIKRIKKAPNKVLGSLFRRLHIFRLLNDSLYLKIVYFLYFHKKLDLNNPKTFNEKLQWLKLYDRKELYTKLVDKYEVKKYIASIIGEEYIIPTLAVYDTFDEIDFDKLPDKFVIKCTHDSGGVVIVNDKNNLNIKSMRKKINKSLKTNFYFTGREWPYKDVKPRIIIEKYMENNNNSLEDYKIHVFNGEPKIVLVCKDRYKDTGLTEDFFDINWQHLNIKRQTYDNCKDRISKPKELFTMIELSKKISKDIPFVRTDFYEIDNKVYFGEITFYPASGLDKFIPEVWDDKLGNWITI